MPEDAPGNPGALLRRTRPEFDPSFEDGFTGDGDDFAPADEENEAPILLDKVRGMQAKLHRWAGEDSSRRFGDLFNLVCDYDFLARSWERVRSNRGARTPGVDGLKATEIGLRDGGVSGFLEEIRRQLREGTYEPSPVRQVLIPKKNGKLRKLGIPTVADRVVQGALKLVLEPIFEADFLPCSYGFRPNRSAHDAIAEIHLFASKGYRVVLEADIRSCFDEIGHSALMERVRRRIKDKRVLALVKAFLKAGVMSAVNYYEDSLTGTPQGGLLSPLLANIALSALDERFEGDWQQLMGTQYKRSTRRRKGLANWRLIRYADDFVVMVHGTAEQAEALRGEAAAVLAPMDLHLAEEKTRVVRVEDGFDFLGFRIRKMRKRGTSKYYVYTWPSPKALQAIRDKVAARTYRATRNQDFKGLIVSLNKSLAGWANYFRSGSSQKYFNAVDSFAWHRIMRWLRRKHKGRKGLGMREMRRRFCVPGTWKFAADGVVFTGAFAVKSQRYRYRGRNIPTPWTPQPETALADQAVKTHGAPGARRRARRVRRADRGNPPGATPAGHPGPTPTIMDPEWGHVTIKISGHPPFPAQVILNGHEYVAITAAKAGIGFGKEGNCFTEIADPRGLAQIADAVPRQAAMGRLGQVIDRWIYTACLCFGLDLAEQGMSCFRYNYTVYQAEYSRNLLFASGAQMEDLFDRVIDRTRSRLDIPAVRTIFGLASRPRRHRAGDPLPPQEIVVEKPRYGLTWFRISFGKLQVKAYTKGEHILRLEATIHNTRALRCRRGLDNFPHIHATLAGIASRFATALDCADTGFIADGILDQLPLPSQIGAVRAGGIDLNKPRVRAALSAALALATSPEGFTVADHAAAVQRMTGMAGYTVRQSAYDLRKLRGKDLAVKAGSSRRYHIPPEAARTIAALLVLRDQVLAPIIAGVRSPRMGRKPAHWTAVDRDYEQLRVVMQILFGHLGITARASIAPAA